METPLTFKPVVRNVNTNDLYFHEGGNSFKNIRTGKEGEVSDTAAQKTFLINVPATQILNEYPMVAELINKLDLKYDVLCMQK
jgi:hypothetical protein